MNLDVKEIIQLAKRQFVELLPDLALTPPSQLPNGKRAGEDTQDLVSLVLDRRVMIVRLEELEKVGDNWAVTLSVPNPDFKPVVQLEGIRQFTSLVRVAKIFLIDGETGTLLALRERAA